MPDLTLVHEHPDGSATVVRLRVPEHVINMHRGACTRVEIVDRELVRPEDRV